MQKKRLRTTWFGLAALTTCLLLLAGCGAGQEAALDGSHAEASDPAEAAPGPDSPHIDGPDLTATPESAEPAAPEPRPGAASSIGPSEGAEISPHARPPGDNESLAGPRLTPPEGDRSPLAVPRFAPRESGGGRQPTETLDPARTVRSLEPRMVEPRPLRAPPDGPEASRPGVSAVPPESIAAGDTTEASSPRTDDSTASVEPATSADGSPEAAPVASEREGYQVVKVFYGTDRKAEGVTQPPQNRYLRWLYLTSLSAAVSAVMMFAAVRLRGRTTPVVLAAAGVLATVGLGVVTTLVRLEGEPVGPRPERSYGNRRGELEMGVCEVSIPAAHRVGAVERPSVLRLEFQEDPRRHVVLLGIEQEPAEAFFARLRERVDASRNRDAFVFVHGFNTTFEDAAQRTAQLAYDLDFDGAPIFYSWPSQGGLLEYSIDETNAEWTVPHLKEFLLAVAEESDAESVHLIAHSMGNRSLTAALARIAYQMRDRLPMFRELVLTAPDIDAEVFRHDVVPAILPTADRVTLYASSNDEALRLSKTMHGYRRAGDSGSELLVIPGVDTIDVSTVDTSLLGHLYYGDNATVIADMLDLINQSKPPQLRPWLRPRQWGEMVYWVFQGEPAGLETSRPATTSVRR
jgi:esterase/lipase superfamily enzyme